MTDAPNTIWLHTNGVSTIDEVHESYPYKYTLTSSVSAQLKAADDLLDEAVKALESLDNLTAHDAARVVVTLNKLRGTP